MRIQKRTGLKFIFFCSHFVARMIQAHSRIIIIKSEFLLDNFYYGIAILYNKLMKLCKYIYQSPF